MMFIIIKTVSTGIHSQIEVDVESAKLEFLPILERIVRCVKEYNDDQNEKA